MSGINTWFDFLAMLVFSGMPALVVYSLYLIFKDR